MKWVLAFVYFYDATPYVEKVSQHRDMTECFYAREALANEVGRGAGHFKLGQQAVCIRMF